MVFFLNRSLDRLETAIRQSNLIQFPKRPFTGMDAYNIHNNYVKTECLAAIQRTTDLSSIRSFNGESDMIFNGRHTCDDTTSYTSSLKALISISCKFPS